MDAYREFSMNRPVKNGMEYIAKNPKIAISKFKNATGRERGSSRGNATPEESLFILHKVKV